MRGVFYFRIPLSTFLSLRLKKVQRKIYDCFLFFNEFDLLKIRLEYLYEHVESFVITESDRTFSGYRKPLFFNERRSEFSRWQKKILYLPFSTPRFGSAVMKFLRTRKKKSNWFVEHAQRDSLSKIVSQLDRDDFFFLTDIDEIWNPETVLRFLQHNPEIQSARLEMDFFYFYLNCKGIGAGNSKWSLPFFATKNELEKWGSEFRNFSFFSKSLKLSKARSKLILPLIRDAGWHFSYLGGERTIAEKLNSFSHQELNVDRFTNLENIQARISRGEDLFGRSEYLWKFTDLTIFPEEFLKVILPYENLIKRLKI